MIWIRNTDLSLNKKLRRFWDDKWASQLMLDVNAISSIFLCQNELILLYSQVLRDFFIKFKHCFFKFKEFSRRKLFSRSFQGPSIFQGVFQARANHVLELLLVCYNKYWNFIFECTAIVNNIITAWKLLFFFPKLISLLRSLNERITSWPTLLFNCTINKMS